MFHANSRIINIAFWLFVVFAVSNSNKSNKRLPPVSTKVNNDVTLMQLCKPCICPSDEEGQSKTKPALKLKSKVTKQPPIQDQFLGKENELFEKLMAGYRKEVLPIRPIIVRLDLLLIKVKATIEKEGIFESVVALFIEWHERRMTWDPKKYNNLQMISFHPGKVWVPDIAMLNSADHPYAISRDENFLVRLANNGTMKFVPTGVSRSWCHLKLVTFPFDVQTCSFEFESWSMSTMMMSFDNRSEALTDQFFASPQWTLCQRRVHVYDHVYNFTHTVEIFSRIRFDFVVRRKSTFYIVNLIFPCATLSIIQLLTFILPSKETIPDRVGFGMTNVLTLVVFQTIITEEMPKSSDAITSLSDYIIALIITSAAGIFQSVYVERMLRAATKPPPEILLRFLEYVPMLWNPNLPESNVEEEEKKRNKEPSTNSLTSYQKALRRHHSSSSVGGDLSTGRTCSLSSIIKRRGIRDEKPEETHWLTVVVENPSPVRPVKGSSGSLLAPPPLLASRRQSMRRMSYVEVSGSKIVSFIPLSVTSSMQAIADDPDKENAKCFNVNEPIRGKTIMSRRKSRVIDRSQSMPDIVLGIKLARLRNGRAWATFANRLDALLFLICLPLSFALPLGLFLPLVLAETDCRLQEMIDDAPPQYY